MRILLVEDHHLVREGLTRLLREVLPDAQVRTAGCIAEARERLAWAERVLLDLSLPDGHGLGFLEEIAQQYPDLPVVILTAYDEPAFQRRAAALGAVAFLSKADPPDALRQALVELKGPARPVPYTDRLSPTEQQVLALLGEGLSTAQIARRLGVEEKTVYTHRRRLMFKLGLKSAQALVRFAALYHTGLTPPSGKKFS